MKQKHRLRTFEQQDIYETKHPELDPEPMISLRHIRIERFERRYEGRMFYRDKASGGE